MNLEETYNSVRDAYIKHLEKKHNITFVEFAKSAIIIFENKKKDVISINYEDIRYDINTNQPKHNLPAFFFHFNPLEPYHYEEWAHNAGTDILSTNEWINDHENDHRKPFETTFNGQK